MSGTEIYSDISELRETLDLQEANSLIKNGWRLLLVCNDFAEVITATEPQYYQAPRYVLGLPTHVVERNNIKYL